jgi:hypothetical protein
MKTVAKITKVIKHPVWDYNDARGLQQGPGGNSVLFSEQVFRRRGEF